VKIALAQINPTIGAFSSNIQKILEYARSAGEQGADLAVFPELSICGYPPADLIEKASFLERSQVALDEIAAATAIEGMPAILCGTVLRSEGRPGKDARNVAALCSEGKVQFVQQKMLLPFYDVFDEQRYFEPATSQSLVTLRGETLAITVCEDAWNDKGFWPERYYPADPVEKLMTQPCVSCPHVLLNISASPYWNGKPAVRRAMLAALAKRYNCVVALANQVGGNDSLIFDGGSLVIAPTGEVVVQAVLFDEDMVFFDTADAASSSERLKEEDRDEIAATWDALVLGTRDYVKKCGFSKALVGLSGGIDSAVVAAIAVEALGAANVLGIGMPSGYSSTGSVEDARALALLGAGELGPDFLRDRAIGGCVR